MCNTQRSFAKGFGFADSRGATIAEDGNMSRDTQGDLVNFLMEVLFDPISDVDSQS